VFQKYAEWLVVWKSFRHVTVYTSVPMTKFGGRR
jgi:hypothetical protein